MQPRGSVVADWRLVRPLSFLALSFDSDPGTYSQVHYWTHFSVGPQLARAHLEGQAEQSATLASNFGAASEHFEVIMDAPHDRVHVVYREKVPSLFRPDMTKHASFLISELREQKR